MDLTFANTNWLNPLWPQGTTALKYYCCGTQTIILLSQWKAPFPTSCSVALLHFIAKGKIQWHYWETREWPWQRPSCSRGTQNTISADSNINCRRHAECKHYSTAGCDIWANHLWVLDKISQMWQRFDWCSHYSMLIVSLQLHGIYLGCIYNLCIQSAAATIAMQVLSDHFTGQTCY